MRLSDHTGDTYSQFGEDGCIAHIFDRIGIEHRLCVDFGAGDGLSCSNTAALWRDQDWAAVLIEPDVARFDDLEGNAGPFNTIRRRAFVTPEGPSSISAILQAEGIVGVDLMSIDVDGPDWHILRSLGCRPRVIVIEFNPTIPPHIDAHQADIGGTFGASLLAMIRLGESLGYRFVGATYCNAFLVLEPLAGPFAAYETDPSVLFSPGEYTYAVTDFAGRVVHLGKGTPWGTHDPYVRPIEASAYVLPPTDNPLQLRRGFESIWGPSLLLSPNGLTPESLTGHLAAGSAVVCIDLSTADLDATAWIGELAAALGYLPLFAGRVLGLVRQEPNA